MRSEGENAAVIRAGPAYWLPWLLVVVSILLLRVRIGVPGAPALLPNGVEISLAVDARGCVWVSTGGRDLLGGPPGLRAPHPCIWRIDRWNRLHREVGNPSGGQDPDGSPILDARLDEPYLLGFDGQGRLYFDDRAGLYRVEKDSIVRRLSAKRGWGAVGPDGSVYRSSTHAVVRRPPNGPEDVLPAIPDRGLPPYPAVAVAVAADGSVYVADPLRHSVRRVSLGGAISTVAGTGRPGYRGHGGPATAARLNQPSSVGVDHRGRVLVGDFRNYRLRRIEPAGTMVTVAGCGRGGYSGNGGPATRAMLMCAAQPQSGPRGEVFFVDASYFYDCPCVRKVDARGVIRAVAVQGMVR